jgi:hypothetical protein
LLDVRRLVELDTPELFETIQDFNPFAEEARAKFTSRLDKIEAELRSAKGGTV